jgi:hypothetical protein
MTINEAGPAFREDERSLTVAEFCALERMSATTYHKLKKQGLAPQEVRFPGMAFVRVTAEARREWHRKIEALRKEQASALEEKRRSARMSELGKRAAQSAAHPCRKKRRAAR